MPVHVLLDAKIKPQVQQALSTFIQENLANVRGFNGCRKVDVLFNLEKDTLLLDEIWQSPDHHQAYIASIAESGVMEQLVSYLQAPPNVQYFEMADY